MKLLSKVNVTIFIILLINLFYSVKIGMTANEKSITTIILLALPILFLLAVRLDDSKSKKIFLGLLLGIGVLLTNIIIILLLFTGTFDQVDGVYSLEAVATITLAFSPLIISHIILCKIIYNEYIKLRKY